MEAEPWTAGRLTELGRAYWSSSVLHAALRTGLVDRLAAGPATLDELAAGLELDPRGAAALLKAMQALGLVEQDAGRLRLAPGLAELLDPQGQGTFYYFLMHMADLAPIWGRLDQAVSSGRPIPREEPQPGQPQPAPRRHFYLAMRDQARASARGLAARLGLQAGWHLLDLGGGPGVYGLTFAAETPGLRVTVFDLPASERHFRQEAQGHPGAEGAEFKAGDYFNDNLGGPFQAVWISHILHSLGPEQCQALLDKAAAALAPGGRLWVQDFLLDQPEPAGRFAALFALNMLVNTEQGRSYSAQEVAGFMERAGLVQVQGPEPPVRPAQYLGASKPI